ncbi:hypothetical protein JKF63_00137 [Porcisia hertigi]|uniref:Uncharacterized protein n=1 Tax=Porcisia hertigi TaxID=2761500 RepID=A0A836I913_9TRYP|nr:hypothetical protein JKF63_00137 [Porcisia hertigi]
MRRLARLQSGLCHIAPRLSDSLHSSPCVRPTSSSCEGHHSPASMPKKAPPASSGTLLHKAPTAGDNSGGSGTRQQQQQQHMHPMELLSRVFQQHPPALRLHRELTIALTEGDSARAADLASVLASTIQRFAGAQHSQSIEIDAPSAVSERTEPVSQSDIPAAGVEDVEEALEKTRQELAQQAAMHVRSNVSRGEDAGTSLSASAGAGELPFWRDPEQLCITVLESAFETEVLSGESQDTLTPAGNRAAEYEAEQVRVLDSYLEKEALRWKAQKAAIAKVILDVTRFLGLTPEDLQAAEGISTSPSATAAAVGEQKLNVLRHTNLVIRGEVPSSSPPPPPSSGMASESVEAELHVLEERMSSLGQPLTPMEVRMARYELQMNRSKMRYVVGVHRELQLALDHSAALQRALVQRNTPTVMFSTGTEVFMAEVIRALNEGASAYSASVTAAGGELSVSSVKAREVVESPVLPFTFMLKCSLWFTTPPTSC